MWIYFRLSLIFFSTAGDPLPLALAVRDCCSLYVQICEEQPGPFAFSNLFLANITTPEQCLVSASKGELFPQTCI